MPSVKILKFFKLFIAIDNNNILLLLLLLLLSVILKKKKYEIKFFLVRNSKVHYSD